jgi:hypothetical protein
VVERLKKLLPASRKGLTANSLQRKTEQLKTTEQKKIPNYFVIGVIIICGYFHGLKKMVAENYSYNNPLASSD